MLETLEVRVARLERENAELRIVRATAQRLVDERLPSTQAFRLEDLRRTLAGGFRAREGVQ